MLEWKFGKVPLAYSPEELRFHRETARMIGFTPQRFPANISAYISTPPLPLLGTTQAYCIVEREKEEEL